MASGVSTLVVSVLPRGETFGASALVSLDAESLELLAMREFPGEEYLRDPVLAAPAEIHHCRGIAQVGETLLAALFNGVREYDVEDIRQLELRPGGMLSDPCAVDLHGIEESGGVLAAASTGTDSVLCWDLSSGQASVTPLAGADQRDLRFPSRLAREGGCSDWRQVLDVRLHVNGVSRHGDGSLVVSSLTSVLKLTAGGVQLLVEDRDARMHDGNPVAGEELLLTDAARGTLVMLDLPSGLRRCLAVADPEAWFVRGLHVVDGHAYVLRSEVVPSRQRDPRRRADRPADATQGGCFGVSVVDLAAWALVAERSVNLPEAAPGTVAYGLLGWNDFVNI